MNTTHSPPHTFKAQASTVPNTPLNRTHHFSSLRSLTTSSPSLLRHYYTPLSERTNSTAPSSALATPFESRQTELIDLLVSFPDSPTPTKPRSRTSSNTFADSSSNWRNRIITAKDVIPSIHPFSPQVVSKRRVCRRSVSTSHEALVGSSIPDLFSPVNQPSSIRASGGPHAVQPEEEPESNSNLADDESELPCSRTLGRPIGLSPHAGRLFAAATSVKLSRHGSLNYRQNREITTASPHAICSSCGSSKNNRTVSLQPCSHTICQNCFNGILNIACEKQIECPSCKLFIEDFTPPPGNTFANDIRNLAHDNNCTPDKKERLCRSIVPAFPDGLNPLCSSLAASPKLPSSSVLRIDNVPWDVTPSMLSSWIKVPTHHIHVLLELKTGKTASHAFVEVSALDAKIVLRTCQNKTLGGGRRARPVSITMSSQEELLSGLFPSLSTGELLSSTDADSLAKLIRREKSQFVKAPSLPFHLLISMLIKAPLDSSIIGYDAMRTKLSDLVFTAIEALRSHPDLTALADQANLAERIFTSGSHCPALSSQQQRALQELRSSFKPRSCAVSQIQASITPRPTQVLGPSSYPGNGNITPVNGSTASDKQPSAPTIFEKVAIELGMNRALVESVFRRLYDEMLDTAGQT